MALSFYGNLDLQMLQNIDNVIGTPGLINVSEYRQLKKIGGTTYYDYISNVPYINVSRTGTIEDAQIFVHELMHANDFMMQPKYLDSNYYGFHEVPTYCGDLLLADFMEQNGVNANEVTKIRSEYIHYICGLAHQSLFQIRSKIGKKAFMAGDIDVIYNLLDEDILKSLLEVQSGIMAIGLYNQIQQNRETGINNLKAFMSTLIPKSDTPDFSQIGLDYNTLMTICENIKTHGYDFNNYKSVNVVSHGNIH